MSKKNLIKNIDRIKSLIYEQPSVYDFKVDGDILRYPGVEVNLTENGVTKGYAYLLNIVDAENLETEITELIRKNLLHEKTNKKDIVFLHGLVVEDKYRNLGYGKKIFDKLLVEVKNRSYKKSVFHVDKDNKYAIKIYEKYNFENIFEGDNYFLYVMNHD
jgi:GNAT superfamily N-acetyltransferase